MGAKQPTTATQCYVCLRGFAFRKRTGRNPPNPDVGLCLDSLGSDLPRVGKGP